MATYKYTLTLDTGVTADSLNIQFVDANLQIDLSEDNSRVYISKNPYNISINNNTIRVRFNGAAEGLGKKAILAITINNKSFKTITITPDPTGNIDFEKTYNYQQP